MKIIMNEKDNIRDCENCGVRLLFEEKDVKTGAFGASYIECPNCGQIIYLDDEKYDKHITTENILFPQDFWHSDNAIKVSEDEINRIIGEVVNSLKSGSAFSHRGYGDTTVIGLNPMNSSDSCFEIIVSKNPYECTIDLD